MRGRRRNSPRDRRMHGPSAAGASQYSLHSLGRPHLAELGHLRRYSGAVRRQRQHRPPCRRRVRAGQRVLHQLDLGAEPGRDPHRAVQPPERRLHARRRTASRTRQHRQAAAASRLPDGADRQMASKRSRRDSTTTAFSTIRAPTATRYSRRPKTGWTTTRA